MAAAHRLYKYVHRMYSLHERLPYIPLLEVKDKCFYKRKREFTDISSLWLTADN